MVEEIVRTCATFGWNLGIQILGWLTDFWGFLRSNASVLQLFVVVPTVVYGAAQIRQARKATQIQALNQVHDLLAQRDVEKARTALRDGNYEDAIPYSEGTKDAIELVSRSYDRAGFLLWLKLIPERDLLANYSASALFQWSKLCKYIERQRGEEKYEARRYFEYLAWRSQRYRRRLGLPMSDELSKESLFLDLTWLQRQRSPWEKIRG
ncbi:MAG: hypothetical protein HYX92_10975 [Chloroflexi bacterium]|nr:hypothetical protein [Chloroflexota bacterium]